MDAPPRLQDLRVAVVGAGPAGWRAAETLVAHGLRPTIIDEAPAPGGQIYRQMPQGAGFSRSPATLYGFEARKATACHRGFAALLPRLDYRPGHLVWEVEGKRFHLWDGQARATVDCDAAILATGAMDRIMPFPGWTLPGIYNLGGAQIALKYQGLAIGRRVLLLGSGPLLYLVAYQYAKAGAEIVALLDTSRRAGRLAALPDLLAGGMTFAKGLYYLAWLRARGIRIEQNVTPIAAEGADGVVAFRYRRAGQERRVDCDAIGFGYGLKSETQLADLAGCAFAFDPGNRQWLPETDAEGRSSRADIYLAGDGVGIAGADAAEQRGELAALALIADHGGPENWLRRKQLQAKLVRLARFRRGLERAFPYPAALARDLPDATILCRCEAITAGELRATALQSDATELNRAKAYCRVGMGRCQGRLCGPPAAEILAAARRVPIDAVGRLRGQPPVKPLPIGALLPETEA